MLPEAGGTCNRIYASASSSTTLAYWIVLTLLDRMGFPSMSQSGSEQQLATIWPFFSVFSGETSVLRPGF